MRNRKKILPLLMTGAILIPSLGSSYPVFGEDKEKASANTMTRSMVSFFREGNTDLQVARTSPEEVKVYGVFLSNFFVPWSTTLGDIISDKGDKALSNKVSKKFFGTTDKAKTVLEINKKVYQAIDGTLRENSTDFAMLNSKGASRPMTGEEFYNKISNKSKTRQIFGESGRVYFDLEDEATQASMQVLFGLAPDFMVSKKKGLRKLTAMYVDGFGNVWGSPKAKAAIKDYVLVLPASLNPGTFPSLNGEMAFPMANVFTMGGVVKPAQNYLGSAKYNTPYYNLKSYLPDTTYDKGNAVSIIGIQSPTGYIGRTNNLMTDGVNVNPHDSVKKMLDQDGNSSVSGGELSIIVSPDPSKMTSVAPSITGDDKLTAKQKQNVVSYLLRATALPYSKVSDDMYYFKTPNAGKENASGKEEGSFANVQDLIPKQRLFVKEGESSNEYQFYSGSYVASPFNNFLKQYWKAKDKDAYLKGKVKDYKKGDASSEALKKFLSTGTWGTKTDVTIESAMNKMRSDKQNVYKIIPPSKHYGTVTKDSWNWTFKKIMADKEPFMFGLTSSDSIFAKMSFKQVDKGWFSKDNLSDHRPFIDDDAYGRLGVSAEDMTQFSKTKGKPLSDKDTRTIATLFHTGMTYRSFSLNAGVADVLTGVASGAGKYDTPWGKGTLVNKTAIMSGVNNFPGIYWGYMVSLLRIQAKADGSGFEEPNPFVSEHLPDMDIDVIGGDWDLNEIFGEAGVVESEDKSFEDMQKDIVKKVYGLLSTKDSTYRDALVKSAQDSWVTSTHRAITGSWVNNELSVSAGGGDTYASSVGYINSPSLAELPLASWVLTDYFYLYLLIFLIITALVIMTVIMHVRTIKQGLSTLVVMGFVLLLPQYLVSNVVGASNAIGDKIFSERFNFWAIAQHQQTNKKLADASLSNDEMDYIVASSMLSAKEAYSQDPGVRVKWMSPKKDNMFDSIFTEKSGGETLAQNTVIFRWLFSSYLNDETYNYSDPLATYVYRPYNAIARDAKESYAELNPTVLDRKSVIDKTQSVKKNVLGLDKDTFYLYGHPEGKVFYSKGQLNKINSVKAYKTDKDINKLENYRYWSINNSDVANAIFRSNFTDNVGYTGNTTDKYYRAYSLMTESPFYYFYNVFKHRYATGGEFKNALVNLKTFKVNSSDSAVDNKMRDFMDMEGLFTYVVPYLNQGNKYVYGYTGLYGKDIEGYDFSTSDGTPTSKQKELKARFDSEKLAKQNMKNVWKLYTPWVDQLYSQDVFNIDVPIANKKVMVKDIINPSSYHSSGRPMVFSEADMRAKNYAFADLSAIERKILETQKATYKDLMYLTNYYAFDDEVLITAAAMSATFNFNREFSENKVIGESSVLYPQGYELKNFNYDAFMRLMLLNATGEPVIAQDDKDLYVRVIEKTSIFTGVILIMTDVLGVIAIPAMKFFALLALFFLTIVLSVSVVITPPERMFKTVFKNIFAPSLIYLVASAGFAFVISLFVGDGLSDMVGSRSIELSITDPTVMMLGLIIVDCVYMYVLFRLIQMLLSSLKLHATDSVLGAIGVVGSVTEQVVSTVKSTVLGATGVGSRVAGATGAGGVGSGSSSASSGRSSTSDDYGDYDDYPSTAQPMQMGGTDDGGTDPDLLDRIERLSSTNNSPVRGEESVYDDTNELEDDRVNPVRHDMPRPRNDLEQEDDYYGEEVAVSREDKEPQPDSQTGVDVRRNLDKEN